MVQHTCCIVVSHWSSQISEDNVLLRRQEPPAHSNNRDDRRNTDSVVHIRGSDRLDRREEQYHADEEHPNHGDQIDGLTPAAHSVRTRYERDAVLVDAVRDDDGDVAEVECRCGDTEDTHDSLRRSNADQVQAGAEGHDEPDGVDGGLGEGVYFAPEAGQSR